MYAVDPNLLLGFITRRYIRRVMEDAGILSSDDSGWRKILTEALTTRIAARAGIASRLVMPFAVSGQTPTDRLANILTIPVETGWGLANERATHEYVSKRLDELLEQGQLVEGGQLLRDLEELLSGLFDFPSEVATPEDLASEASEQAVATEESGEGLSQLGKSQPGKRSQPLSSPHLLPMNFLGMPGKKSNMPYTKAHWGELFLFYPKLEDRRSLDFRVKGQATRHHRPRFSGALRYPGRALLPGGDGKAFGVKRPYRGGSLLIDLSGSMQLNLEEVKKFVVNSPAALVACYASHSGDYNTGVLAIISKRGRIIKNNEQLKDVLGNGNVVDGPALRWLSQQAKPRLWLSDGKVTGVGDSADSRLQQETVKICEAFNIRRILRLREVMNVFSYH